MIFNRVRADDALLDALGGRSNPLDCGGDESVALLLAWRTDVDSDPIADLVDTDMAMAVIAAGRRDP